MMYYMMLPPAALVCVVLQTTLADMLSRGAVRLEVSLVLALYAGFHLGMIRGAALVVVFGFVMDTLTGTVPCFYTLFYILVFLVARVVSFKVYGEGAIVIMSAAFLCVLGQAVVIVALSRWTAGVPLSFDGMEVTVYNAVLLALTTPLFFALFKKIEVSAHGESSR